MLHRQGVCLPALAVVIIAFAATPVFAGDGFYVGVSGGSSLFHEDRDDLDNAVSDAFNVNHYIVSSSTSTLRNSTSTYSGIIGYQVVREVSIEASYTDLGRLRYHSDNVVLTGFLPLNASANLTAKAQGPTLAVLGVLPLGPQFEICARAGVFFSKVTLAANIFIPAEGQTASHGAAETANSVDPLVGAGLAWNATKHVKIRAEYTRFGNVGDKNKRGGINIDTFNVGLTYSFR